MTRNHNLDEQRQSTGNNLSTRKVQLFRAGSLHGGISVDEIATIAQWREPTPLPNAPRAVIGIVSLQGRMLTVLNLASLTTGDAESVQTVSNGDAELIDSPGFLIALRGDEQLALAVDEVGETIETSNDELDMKRDPVSTLVLGILHYEGRDMNILNPRELFSAAIQGRERRRRRF